VTWGGFLNEIQDSIGITFAWDALKIIDSGLLFAETRSEGKVNEVSVYFPSSAIPSTATISREVYAEGFLSFFLDLGGILTNMLNVSLFLGITVGSLVGIPLGFRQLFTSLKPVLWRLFKLISYPIIISFLGAIISFGVIASCVTTFFTSWNIVSTIFNDLGRFSATVITFIFMLWLILGNHNRSSVTISKWCKQLLLWLE
jgi:hypothetical protein